jgi:cytochrome b
MSVPGELGGNQKAATTLRVLRVWDSPTRIMHWVLVTAIAICWSTGETGDLEYHHYAGYVALWVVMMRVYWGFAGSSTARFANFVRGPQTVFKYVRTLHLRNTPATLGHNALGAISVLALLAAVAAVGVTGLFAVDMDVLYSGPLSMYVDFREGRRFARWHSTLFDVLLVVIALHLLAVSFYYAYKRQNLVASMITGKRKAAEVHGEELQVAPVWRLLLGAAIASTVIWVITTGFFY